MCVRVWTECNASQFGKLLSPAELGSWDEAGPMSSWPWTVSYGRGHFHGLFWFASSFILFVMIIFFPLGFLLFFCMELANRIELGSR